MTKDTTSLDGSKHRKSSAHGSNEFMSVTVRKEDPKEKAGIKLHMEENGRIRVKEIAKNGLFADTEVAVGDIILSVNALRLKPGEDASTMAEIIKNAKDKVTLVVKKSPKDGSQAETKSLKRSSSHKSNKPIADNNATTKQVYQSKAVHNIDGSIRLGTSDDYKVSMGEQVTISATKEAKSQDVKVEFIVEDRKIYVTAIHDDSIFADTRLEVGDHILAINDMSFREFGDAKYAGILMKKAEQVVTVIVEKGKAPASLKSQVEAYKTAQRKKRPGTATRSGSTSSTGSFASSGDEGSISDDDSFGADNDVRDMQKKRASTKTTSIVTITVPKSHQHDHIGLKLIVPDTKGNKLVVDKIDTDSIFITTSLALGDRILSINNEDFRRAPNPKKALETMRLANEAISVIVQKSETTFQQANFDLDASSGNLVY